MRTFKRIILGMLILMVMVMALPAAGYAAGPINPDMSCALRIAYQDDGHGIAGVEFRLYQVADMDTYARMTLTPEFEAYRDTVSGLSNLDHMTQNQWTELAQTLKGYVEYDALIPTAVEETDADGMINFTELPIGLYLVTSSSITTEDGFIYTATPFMAVLPWEDIDDNIWVYELTAEPKYTREQVPEEEYVTRKVLKIWEDEGYESIRPAEVIVQLLKDGKVFDTQTLNRDNNWRYTWEKLDPEAEWSIIEKEVPGYAVSIGCSGITFTVTNHFVPPIKGTDLPIQKRMTGDKPEKAAVFEFILTAQDVLCPMPAGCSGTVKEYSITGAGTVNMGEISFDSPGTYVYTVCEKNGEIVGYTYDKTVYTITFEVTEQDGKLNAVMSIHDEKGNAASALEFTNDYKTPGNKVPQTGVLWWPVPILLSVGLVSLLIGIIRRRRAD